jgi:hypothetical protein
MYRNIGINMQREAIDILRYKKMPALNHSTKINTDSTNSPQQNNTATGNPSSSMMININGHTYNFNKKNITTIGIGAAALVGGIAIKKLLSRD